MKKTMRFMAAMGMVLIMMTGLTGCRQFEKLRQSQVTITKEGTLLARGEEYRALPYCKYLNPEWSLDSLYLTPEDVPVLLSKQFGTWVDISEDGRFIEASIISEESSLQGSVTFDYDGATYQVYCRAGEYDSIMAMIEKGYEPDGYMCEYYDWELNEDSTYVFTEEEAAAVETVLTGTPTVGGDTGFIQSFSISSCMKRTPFSQYEFEFMVSDADEYFLEKYDEENDSFFYYAVPADLKPIFENILLMVNS